VTIKAKSSCALVIIIWVLIGYLLFGCSHLTVAPKPVNAHAIAFDKNTQNAGIIDCDTQGCKVTRLWLDKYRQLETTFKQTFAGDVNIKPEGDHYRAPYDCVELFTRLKAQERGSP
jgi:hypothetical protein